MKEKSLFERRPKIQALISILRLMWVVSFWAFVWSKIAQRTFIVPWGSPARIFLLCLFGDLTLSAVLILRSKASERVAPKISH